MRIGHLLQDFFSQHARRCIEPVVQQLEARTLLASDPLAISFSRGVLTVTGSANADNIVVSRVSNSWTISNDSWTTTRTFAVSRLTVNAKAGDDAITLDASVTTLSYLYGDVGNDTITSANGPSVIYGNAGDDSLTGGSGNDSFAGDVGNDTIVGGAGNNKISGGAGADVLSAGSGNDSISGDVDNDTIDGGDGNNTLNGNAGDDSVTGGSGNDYLIGDVGNDTLVGNAGNNKLVGGAGSDHLSAGGGNDWLQGDADQDTLLAGDGANTLLGGLGNDSLTGGSGADLVQGGLGDDAIDGAGGVDTLDYADHTALQHVTASLANGTGGMTGETDTFANVEILRGGAGHDHLTGSDNSDTIFGLNGNDTILGGAGGDKLYGNIGNDSLQGDDGADSLYGGAGNDALTGGADDDLLIAVGGGGYDSLGGSEGSDTFWLDSNATELLLDVDADEVTAGAVHRVGAFANKASKELDGQAIADPSVTSKTIKYRNFKLNPVFASDGPSIDDVRQGQLGDCYFLAQLGSFAKLAPDLIKQSIVEFGDGTYGVQFNRGTTKYFYRIDADLPTYSPSTLAYAALGSEGSTWVALFEKAFAMFRQGKNSYASISSGFMTEVASAFGRSSTWGWSTSNPSAVLAMLKGQLDEGKSVSIGTGNQPAGSPLVGGHAYTIEAITDDGAGNYTVTLRNPWAIDGYITTDGVQDGYVTISGAQFAQMVNTYAIANA